MRMVPPVKTSFGGSESTAPKSSSRVSTGEFIQIGKLISLPKQAPVVIQKVNKMNPKSKEAENIPPVERNKTARTTPKICYKCGAAFKNNTNLKMHELRHSGVKDFACQSCDQRFVNSYLLKMHVRVRHLGERPFECKFCDWKFFTSAARSHHQRTQHIRDWSYKCDLCSAMFNTKTDLNRHKYRHTGQAPYRCEVCNESFPRRHNLIHHCGSQSHNKEETLFVDSPQVLITDED